MVTEMGIHQIRVVASKDEQGEPAPEGIHKDGFDYVGIFCINRDGISGRRDASLPREGTAADFRQGSPAG